MINTIENENFGRSCFLEYDKIKKEGQLHHPAHIKHGQVSRADNLYD